jgi:hypothetical protein
MEYINNFEQFKLNENKETYTVYNEQSLMRIIKNVFNNYHQSSIKDITLSIKDRKIVYYSKYRKRSNLPSEDKPYEYIIQGDEFVPFLTNIMKYIWDNPRIEFGDDNDLKFLPKPELYVFHT